MLFSPIKYEEPVFRPPAEAYSVILQPTIGCSWNRCAFCEMYSTKKFRICEMNEIEKQILQAAKYYKDVKKIFIADGDAMTMPTNTLLHILKIINEHFLRLQRVSIYALPKNILSKSLDELKALRNAGLKLLYVGIESGDDEVLSMVNKGETFSSTVEALLNAQAAGMNNSVMILTGLGGKKYSEQHAINSAKILNHIKPQFASTLVLSFPFGEQHYIKRFKGEYIPMTPFDILNELKLMIQYTNLTATIFRSDHASNYIQLKGTLPKDKQLFIQQIDYALAHPKILRSEWQRGL